jgi:hypothetical protein
MINKTQHLIHAVKLLPVVNKRDISLNVPHLVVDWHSQRNINQGADDYGVATARTTKLEPLNKGRHPAQKTYHVFHITGGRVASKGKGRKFEYVSRPRPITEVPVVMKVTKEYRRHCAGH